MVTLPGSLLIYPLTLLDFSARGVISEHMATFIYFSIAAVVNVILFFLLARKYKW